MVLDMAVISLETRSLLPLPLAASRSLPIRLAKPQAARGGAGNRFLLIFLHANQNRTPQVQRLHVGAKAVVALLQRGQAHAARTARRQVEIVVLRHEPL